MTTPSATAPSSSPTSHPASASADPAAAAQLGPEHEGLCALAGTWSVTFTSYRGSQTIHGSGMATFTPLFAGRYLREDFQCDVAGTPFAGLGIRGFDRAAGRYVSTWIGSMGTSIECTSGTASEDGREVRLTGTSVCPEAGSTLSFTHVYRHESPDRFTLTMFTGTAGEPERKSMDMLYERRP